MAEIAFVSDIKGVCSNGDTRLISSKPRNAESMNTNNIDSSNCMGG
jgi:hypothetical protein